MFFDKRSDGTEMGAFNTKLQQERVRRTHEKLPFFKEFLDKHCEIHEDYHMPLVELCAAFWQYSKQHVIDFNITLSDLRELIHGMVCLVKTEYKIDLKRTGFSDSENKYIFYYICGMRLKKFPC